MDNVDYLDEFLLNTAENYYATKLNDAFVLSDNINFLYKYNKARLKFQSCFYSCLVLAIKGVFFDTFFIAKFQKM